MEVIFRIPLLLCMAVLCISQGCDPKTIDFYKAAYHVEADDNFQDEWLEGLWYSTRWYLPQKSTVSDEVYDAAGVIYRKNGFPDSWFVHVNARVKTSKCCNTPREDELRLRSKGVYDTYQHGKHVQRVTMLYGSEVFLLEIICIGPNDEDQVCADYGVIYWARCPEPRPQDVAKSVMIMKKLCYPHMKRFLCSKHEMDCLDLKSYYRNTHSHRGRRMGYWADEHAGCDDYECDGMRRRGKHDDDDNDDDNDDGCNKRRRWNRKHSDYDDDMRRGRRGGHDNE